MPLMGSLYIGTSGLQTSQNALNTTAHNLSNVDTKGYTRQQVQQSDRSYITISKTGAAVSYEQTGLGVIYSRAKQVRDYFLDKTYRRESGRSMFYEVSTEVMEEVESQLGELNGEAFQTTLTDFWTAIQELTKDPASSVTQGLLVQKASEFVERANAVYYGLSSYQDNLNAQIKQQVDKINDYGNKILYLNDKIRAIESGGVEHANDLRDERNRMLDELAELTKMSWSEDMYGNVAVQIEGVDFVKGSTCYEMGLQVDERNGFYTPYWPQNASYIIRDDGSKYYNIDGAEVFNLSIEVSSDLGTDVGGLKAMLLARGDHRANYTDIEEDYDGVSQSVLMNIQSEFDQLIHNVVGKINGILADAAGVKTGKLTLADGTVLENAQYCSNDEGGYMRNENGSPIQLFAKITTDGYSKVTATDEEGNTGEYWVYNEESAAKRDSLYTIENLQVDPGLMQRPANLGFRKPDGSEDNETAEALKAAFTEEAYTLNPNVKKRTCFVDYYDDLVSQIANSGYVFRSIYTNQVNTVESTYNAREQVTGVSSDEELSNMIKFQNVYNASSRYINVISEMIEHIINTLGM
ncbi:MAG: flagellar hook-associated protein FlgK [Lachnospiraceae bacterium]|nr:flagellar hook-associated protein FlgK [Lachnospiraceae bacterium]